MESHFLSNVVLPEENKGPSSALTLPHVRTPPHGIELRLRPLPAAESPNLGRFGALTCRMRLSNQRAHLLVQV